MIVKNLSCKVFFGMVFFLLFSFSVKETKAVCDCKFDYQTETCYGGTCRFVDKSAGCSLSNNQCEATVTYKSCYLYPSGCSIGATSSVRESCACNPDDPPGGGGAGISGNTVLAFIRNDSVVNGDWDPGDAYMTDDKACPGIPNGPIDMGFSFILDGIGAGSQKGYADFCDPRSPFQRCNNLGMYTAGTFTLFAPSGWRILASRGDCGVPTGNPAVVNFANCAYCNPNTQSCPPMFYARQEFLVDRYINTCTIDSHKQCGA